jgi:hypothetical protein
VQFGRILPAFRRNLLNSYSRSKRTTSNHTLRFNHEDGGSMFFGNVGKPLPEHVAPYHRRQYFSFECICARTKEHIFTIYNKIYLYL